MQRKTTPRVFSLEAAIHAFLPLFHAFFDIERDRFPGPYFFNVTDAFNQVLEIRISLAAPVVAR